MKKFFIGAISCFLSSFSYADTHIITDVYLSDNLIKKGVAFSYNYGLLETKGCQLTNKTPTFFHIDCDTSSNSIDATVYIGHPFSYSDKYDRLVFINPIIGKGHVNFAGYGVATDDSPFCYMTSGFTCYKTQSTYPDNLPYMDNYGGGSKLIINHLHSYGPDDSYSW